MTCRRPERPAPWLAAIVRQEAMRRLARPRETAAEDVADRIDERTLPIDERVIARLVLHEALAPLSDQDRRLLWLRYGDDQTQPATARLLGLPEGTVKVRLHRLRKQLRHELGQP
jgi:RNA polymerase sigma-70 factor (ECF subfamily)